MCTAFYWNSRAPAPTENAEAANRREQIARKKHKLNNKFKQWPSKALRNLNLFSKVLQRNILRPLSKILQSKVLQRRMLILSNLNVNNKFLQCKILRPLILNFLNKVLHRFNLNSLNKVLQYKVLHCLILNLLIKSPLS